MTRFGELLKIFADGESPHIVYQRSNHNLKAWPAAVAPIKPELRGAPPGLPFHLDVPTPKAGLNFTLTTSLGWLDLLGEITGGGRYEDLLPHSIQVELFGTQCRVLDLGELIRTKRAAGRPKDFEAIGEWETLRERRKQT